MHCAAGFFWVAADPAVETGVSEAEDGCLLSKWANRRGNFTLGPQYDVDMDYFEMVACNAVPVATACFTESFDGYNPANGTVRAPHADVAAAAAGTVWTPGECGTVAHA